MHACEDLAASPGIRRGCLIGTLAHAARELRSERDGAVPPQPRRSPCVASYNPLRCATAHVHLTPRASRVPRPPQLTTRVSIAHILTFLADQPALRQRLVKELSLPAMIQAAGDDSQDRVVRAAMVQCLRAAFIVAATVDAAIVSSPLGASAAAASPATASLTIPQSHLALPPPAPAVPLHSLTGRHRLLDHHKPTVHHDALNALTRYLSGGGDNVDGALYVLSQLRWSPEATTAFVKADGLRLLSDALTLPKASFEGRGYAAEAMLNIVGKPAGALGARAAQLHFFLLLPPALLRRREMLPEMRAQHSSRLLSDAFFVACAVSFLAVSPPVDGLMALGCAPGCSAITLHPRRQCAGSTGAFGIRPAVSTACIHLTFPHSCRSAGTAGAAMMAPPARPPSAAGGVANGEKCEWGPYSMHAKDDPPMARRRSREDSSSPSAALSHARTNDRRRCVTTPRVLL